VVSPKPPKSRHVVVDPKPEVANKTLADFVTKSSRGFFFSLAINDSFLDTDPAEWSQYPRYIAAARKVGGLRVVNDFAERGVALMEEFNLALTKDEDQKQYPSGGGGPPGKILRRQQGHRHPASLIFHPVTIFPLLCLFFLTKLRKFCFSC
jgi:hypothetical protein